ncbi:sugar transferase [Candidatus Pelagibacter sp. HIMB1623]|uniref:sugar transferase n=1 Tax=Candidatus Pelagibacter sp. HIMB1623 TaxID=3413358 RepID=UPI003F8521CA
MIKRTIDIIFSLSGLLFFSPILILFLILVWRYDKKSPLYISQRIGKNSKIFNLIKIRTMTFDADKKGISSTSDNDTRIIPIGQKIRKYKIDELTQLFNVLIGNMSLVGPRPNVKSEVDFYTEVEKELLLVKPGITDFSSIVFSDEGKILENKENPDLSYNQLIRPWKSRLGLIYIKHQSIFLDFELIIYTLVALISKPIALKRIVKKLKKFNVNKKIIEVAKRENELYPYPPPGSDKIAV